MTGSPTRSRLAAALETLTIPGGLLHVNSPHASVNDARFFHAPNTPTSVRRRLHRELLEEYESDLAIAATQGRAVIITGGAPGAGKSSIVNSLRLEGHWRTIDPDGIKDLLLATCVPRGDFVGTQGLLSLPDGATIQPRELSGLVHQESTYLSARLRKTCLGRGENIIIQGTLSWRGMPAVLISELLNHGYQEVRIVDVETTKTTAVQRAQDRWWSQRIACLEGRNALGGRYVPRQLIEEMYQSRRWTFCEENARRLFDLAEDSGIGRVELTVFNNVSSPVTAPALRINHPPSQALSPKASPSVGSTRCRRCGRQLRDSRSIARGLGPSCARTR